MYIRARRQFIGCIAIHSDKMTKKDEGIKISDNIMLNQYKPWSVPYYCNYQRRKGK